MRISSYNNKLYDSVDFDKYNNYYAITVNQNELNAIYYNANILCVSYTNVETMLMLSTTDTDSINRVYKIIYGHFYNDQNYFLFKRVKQDKIVGYNVHLCKKAELWHDKFNKLYISNYFDNVKQTIVTLNNDVSDIVTNESCLSYIYYEKETERLEFMTIWTSKYNHDDEMIIIDIQNPYQIKPT